MGQRGAQGPGLIIRNGQIVTAEGQYRADVRVHGEKIVEIGRDLPRGEDEGEIDARGLLILPGGIDPHVHLTVPGPIPAADRWVDDLDSGSRAALAGGITTLGNISFPLPGETPLDTLEREARAVEGLAIADLILHPVLLPPIEPAVRTLPRLVAEGCTTIKIFMCEVAATQRAVAMGEDSGAALYVVHLSCERALRVCEAARARSLPVYVETRPLYLHFTQERYHDPEGPLYVGQPPLREAHDVAALWGGWLGGPSTPLPPTMPPGRAGKSSIPR